MMAHDEKDAADVSVDVIHDSVDHHAVHHDDAPDGDEEPGDPASGGHHHHGDNGPNLLVPHAAMAPTNRSPPESQRLSLFSPCSPSPLSRVTFPTHGRTRAIARLESVACIKLIEDYLIRTPPKGSVGRTETARFEPRTAKSGLASEGLRHEIAAEAKSDGIDGMRHAVGDVRRDVDAETLELALRHVQRGDRNHGIGCAMHQ